MYIEESYNPLDHNDYENQMTPQEKMEETKKMDRGYNKIYRMIKRDDGKNKRKKIEIYTSGDIGSNIRDAETGEYYKQIVGSRDEDLFYKVGLSTGECKSSNGSNTLFYLSPEHYATHMHSSVDPEIAENWNMKRKFRLEELNKMKTSNATLLQTH
jgi:hypothetical protein